MDVSTIALLAAGGLFAGVINTLAGGGSMLTVPMLVMVGLPGTLANGSNRLGVLVQSLFAARSFGAQGLRVLPQALPVLVPVGLGSAIGAFGISQVADAVFERAFGLVMLALLAPTLRPPRVRAPAAPMPGGDPAAPRPGTHDWPPLLRFAVFFAIGAYGGAFQAGVGLVLLLALARAGYDLVTANAIKVIVIALLTLVAFPVFIAQGQVAWGPAAALAAGFAAGGELGARLAVRGGDRLIRPVVGLAVVALAARMLGLW